MQSKSRQAALRIREAFLALSDDVLLAKVLAWAEELDPTQETWDTIGEYFVMTGYQVQSSTTGAVYGSLDDLLDAEEDAEAWTTLPPTPTAIRQAITALSSDEVYHALVSYLGEVLRPLRLTQVWGEPPNTPGDRSGGFDFMKYCAIYLRALAGQAHPRKPKEGKLISRQDFYAMQAFLASEDGYDLPLDDGDEGIVDDPWEDPPPAPPAPPVVCMCGGTFRLAERWLVAAGGDVAVNLAALRENGQPCDCMVVQVDVEWPGPELRPVIDDWNPFDRPKKKKRRVRSRSRSKRGSDDTSRDAGRTDIVDSG